jgi:hypothetical protein
MYRDLADSTDEAVLKPSRPFTERRLLSKYCIATWTPLTKPLFSADWMATVREILFRIFWEKMSP